MGRQYVSIAMSEYIYTVQLRITVDQDPALKNRDPTERNYTQNILWAFAGFRNFIRTRRCLISRVGRISNFSRISIVLHLCWTPEGPKRRFPTQICRKGKLPCCCSAAITKIIHSVYIFHRTFKLIWSLPGSGSMHRIQSRIRINVKDPIRIR